MASEEEVQVVINTVATGSGAKDTADQLREIQQLSEAGRNYVPPASNPAIAAAQQQILDMVRKGGYDIGRAGGPPGGFNPPPPGGPPGGGGGPPEDPNKPKTYQPSAAMEALMRAQQESLVGDPAIQGRLYAVRGQQERQFQSLLQERAKALQGGKDVPLDLAPADAVSKLMAAKDAMSGLSGATKDLANQTNIGGMSLLRFAGAATGIGIGFSIYRAAGQILHDVLTALIDDSTKAAQAIQDNTIVYGQNAAAFQQWATTISQQAGIAQTELLQAGTAAQQFGRQIGFGPDQTRGLEAAAVLLARIKGIGVDQAMTQLTQAIQGSTQAAVGLNLQLDAGYVAFTQMNGATAEAFGLLGQGEQEFVRYQSTLEQVGKQAKDAVPALSDLRKAQQELGNEWDKFINMAGPGVLKILSDIIGTADSALQLINKIQDWSVQRNTNGKTILGQDPNDTDFHNELAALDAIRNKLNNIGGNDPNKSISQPITDAIDAIAKYHQQIDASSSDPGFANEAAAATDLASKLTDLKDKASDALDLDPNKTAAQSISVVADQADRANGFLQQMAQHYQQVANLASALVPQQQTLLAALDNEKTAAEGLVALSSNQVQITAEEARIKLSMLPVQEQLTEAANAAAQAQLRAQQAALPSSRAQQNLQDQIRLYTLIAQSPDRSMQERQNALATATALTRRTPEADIAALQAQLAGRPAEYAAQDIANAQRQFQLTQAAALQPDEYLKQQNDLMTQLVTAAKDAAHRTFEIAVQAINLIFQGSGLGPLNDADKKAISDLVGQGVVDALDAAIKSSDRRAASTSLAGAIGAA